MGLDSSCKPYLLLIDISTAKNDYIPAFEFPHESPDFFILQLVKLFHSSGMYIFAFKHRFHRWIFKKCTKTLEGVLATYANEMAETLQLTNDI